MTRTTSATLSTVGARVNGVKRGPSDASAPVRSGGGGASVSTGLSRNVVGGIVRSSATSAVATTGSAGRVSGAGASGITISGGSSRVVIAVPSRAICGALSSGQKANVMKWIAVATTMESQSVLPNEALSRSLAMGGSIDGAVGKATMGPSSQSVRQSSLDVYAQFRAPFKRYDVRAPVGRTPPRIEP